MILVTGGAGFIGSHLVRALIHEGHKVRVLDTLMRGGLDRIQPLIDSGKVDFIQGDIRYNDTLDAVMQGVSTVFHLAATSINRSKVHVDESNDINLQGTINVARSFMRHGDCDNGKFIFASSASVYGEPDRLPMCETDKPKPLTPYCWAKYQSEAALEQFAHNLGLRYVALRYFNVYGPGQNTDAHYTAVIPLFIQRILDGKGPVINGDGSQSMDLVNVYDVVQANLLAMDNASAQGIFNIGSGIQTTVRDLVSAISFVMGFTGFLEWAKSDGSLTVTKRQADITRAREVLGYEPKVKLADGLREVIDYERSIR